MKIGVFLCNAKQCFFEKINYKQLKEIAKEYSEVSLVEEIESVCSETGIQKIKKQIEAQGLTQLVIAGCVPEIIAPVLFPVIETLGINKEMLTVVDIRGQCAWAIVDKDLANKKAEVVLRQALDKNRLLFPAEEVELEVIPKILVIGSGWTGLKTAKELAALGYQVILIEKGKELGNQAQRYGKEIKPNLDKLLSDVQKDEFIKILTETSLSFVSGSAGNFKIELLSKGEKLTYNVGAIVIATEAQIKPNFVLYGLLPSKSIISLSELESSLATSHKKKFGTIVFFVGLKQETYTVVTERVMKAALEIKRRGENEVFIFTGNVKLASDGLDRLYRLSREEGVVYIKLDEMPSIEQKEEHIAVSFKEPILDQILLIKPALLIVDEDYKPAQEVETLANLLRLSKDASGFLQANNIYRLPIFTNRKGVFVVGSVREPMNLAKAWTDVEAVVSQVKALLKDGRVKIVSPKALIHKGKCTICLTCVRFCPHQAISWTNRAVISDMVCEQCGICTIECPMKAIQLRNFSDAQFEAEIKTGKDLKQIKEEEFLPWIVAFCCQNSAYKAFEQAGLSKHSLPFGLQVINIPCAGKIDIRLILKSLENGADGVIVLGCHEGSCYSERGNIYARWRVEIAQQLLSEIGLEPERIMFNTLAANMGLKFAQGINNFQDQLISLGPNPIAK